jgi:hypothetical protein
MSSALSRSLAFLSLGILFTSLAGCTAGSSEDLEDTAAEEAALSSTGDTLPTGTVYVRGQLTQLWPPTPNPTGAWAFSLRFEPGLGSALMSGPLPIGGYRLRFAHPSPNVWVGKTNPESWSHKPTLVIRLDPATGRADVTYDVTWRDYRTSKRWTFVGSFEGT